MGKLWLVAYAGYGFKNAAGKPNKWRYPLYGHGDEPYNDNAFRQVLAVV